MQIQQIFSEQGLRCTQQRKSVYRALVSSHAHPTADELHRTVILANPGISLATVYNTLEAFCRAGLALKLPGTGTNSSARFDAVQDNHLHVRCRRTGALTDVPAEFSKQILGNVSPDTLKQIEKQLGFSIEQVHIELLGQYQKPSP